MDTIEIILAVAIFLVFLGTWDNSGRIDRLQRRVIAKAEGEKRGTEKNLLGIISEMEAEIEAKDEEIKNLKAELNKVKFDYACEVAGEKAEELEESKMRYLRAINVLRSVRHNLRVGGQKEKTEIELAERVKSCIAEYNSTK